MIDVSSMNFELTFFLRCIGSNIAKAGIFVYVCSS